MYILHPWPVYCVARPIMFTSEIAPVTSLLLTLILLSNGYYEIEAAGTGNTAKCADDAFDLYIQKVGETPCMPSVLIGSMYTDIVRAFSGKTYERLRQLCDTRCKTFEKLDRGSSIIITQNRHSSNFPFYCTPRFV